MSRARWTGVCARSGWAFLGRTVPCSKRFASGKRNATSVNYRTAYEQEACSCEGTCGETTRTAHRSADRGRHRGTRRESSTRWLITDSRTRRESVAISDKRLHDRHREDRERRRIRGELRRDGDREGHRVLQHVRAPYVAVFRQ